MYPGEAQQTQETEQCELLGILSCSELRGTGVASLGQEILACLICLILAWPNTALGTLHLHLLPLVPAQLLATRVTARMPLQNGYLKAGFPLPVFIYCDSVLFSCSSSCRLRICETVNYVYVSITVFVKPRATEDWLA